MKKIALFFAALFVVIGMFARTYDGTEKLYFNMAAVNWWFVGENPGGNFAYFTDGSAYAWSAKATKTDGDIWEVTVPAGNWTMVILTRNETNDAPSWGNKWNQTGDIVIPADKNYIQSFSENNATATWGTYTSGTGAILEYFVRTDINSWAADDAHLMTAQEDGSYTISLDFAAGTYNFKVATADWSKEYAAQAVSANCSDKGYTGEGTGNITITLTADATVTIVLGTDDKLCITSTLGEFGEIEIRTWTIVGDSTIIGKNWDVANTAADMSEADGTWTLTLNELEISEAKNYEYKVVANHAWGIKEYPAQGNNTLNIGSTGIYDVTFTWIPATENLIATATRIGGEEEPTPGEDEYSSSVPSQCPDVMLQGFYWDSYENKGHGDTRWYSLNAQANELASYFDLIWLPPSAMSTGGTGYIPTQYSNQSGAWGTREELEKFISAMHARGTKVIADIVINHAGNYSGWCDFHTMNFGEFGSFLPNSTWITADDEVWSAGTGCTKGTYASYDDGQGEPKNYGSARDWDHNSEQVREMFRAYLKWMKKEMKYDGWRYDYCKGFHESHINDYNSAAKNYFSVMEWWDGTPNTLISALERASWNTLTFDFATKYTVFNQGIASGNYAACKGAGLLGAGKSKYAVTFIDSHDSYQRDDNEFCGYGNSMKYPDKLEQCNAYILSMPGVPCVFYPHWVEFKSDIQKMILARKAVGVHSESSVQDDTNNYGYHATVQGTNGTLQLFLNQASSCPAGYTEACKGNGWAIYIKPNSNTTIDLTVTPASGTYNKNITVTMSATSFEATSIYYTTDGSTPTKNSTKYSAPFKVSATTTIKAIAIAGSQTSAVVTREYVIEKEPEVEPDPIPMEGITVRVRIDEDCEWDLTKGVSFWMWHTASDGMWVKAEKTGSSWYTYTFPENTVTPFNIIAVNGNTWSSYEYQTDDITGITESTCYYVTSKGAGIEGDDGSSWKRKATAVDCNYVPGVQPPIVTSTEIINYPNTTKGELFVYATETIERIEIYSCMGALVAAQTVGETSETLDVSDLQNGLYIMRTKLVNGKIGISKFIKQ